MQKYFFFDDYSEGAHPRILEAFLRTNLQQEHSYGNDSFATEAERLIKEAFKQPKAQVHFVATGTQANIICLLALLKPYESVITPQIGHISSNEAGAIEATGHKINAVSCPDGKLTPEAIKMICESHTSEHAVKPRVVCISQTAELGTVYNKQELQDIFETCKKYGLYLYIDGARLGNALMAKNADFDLCDIADLCDIFYLGGTKNGGLIGEAIVIVNTDIQTNFRHYLRQRGGLLAKARAVSVQFLEFFSDNLYLENAKHANDAAQKLVTGIVDCGYDFLNEPVTNLIFPIFPERIVTELEKKFGFYKWSETNEDSISKNTVVHNTNLSETSETVVRLVTSWATTDVAVQEFIVELKRLSRHE